MFDPRALTSAVRSPRFGDDWWQRGVVYQVYPAQLRRLDGDGVGDLPGIIDQLDYLGPDGPRGRRDLAVADLPVARARRRLRRQRPHGGRSAASAPRPTSTASSPRRTGAGIRVILDLVMNHTSDQHPWFVASRASREGPYADWYLWRDPPARTRRAAAAAEQLGVVLRRPGLGVGRRPRRSSTTTRSSPSSRSWTGASRRVEAAQLAMVRGWLDRGVDGFRLDVFNTFLKHPDLPSNPTREARRPWDRQIHLYDRDQPDFPDLIGRVPGDRRQQPGRMSVGELFDGDGRDRRRASRPTAISSSTGSCSEPPWPADAIRAAIADREAVVRPATLADGRPVEPRPAAPGLAARARRRECRGRSDAIARAAAVLLLTLRGTPFLYYGEELGLRDVDVPRDGERRPAGRACVEPGFDVVGPVAAAGRRCRGRPGPAPGSRRGRPWLRLGPDTATRNVAAQARRSGLGPGRCIAG